ncbi:MAG: hypothetical protein IPJ81_06440 [Chitinophagaceae bacterium]|nr:hypothetical protein [Chitinophagaceae bacterium]
MRELTDKEKRDWKKRTDEWSELERVNSLKERSFKDISVINKILFLFVYIFQVSYVLYITIDLSTVKIIIAIGLTTFMGLIAAIDFKYRVWNKFLNYLNVNNQRQTNLS